MRDHAHFEKGSFKPNGITKNEFVRCLATNRLEEKAMASQRLGNIANHKVETANNMNSKEQKNMRQNFSIMDQGPSHGETYTRPHTMIYRKGIKDQNPNSSVSILYNNGYTSNISNPK